MILVLNCGSQSIKWKLFDVRLKKLKEGKRSISNSKKYGDVLKEELGKIRGEKVLIVAHRVVHGGDRFKKPVKVSSSVLKELKKYNKLAPLHNPFNVLGIEAAKKVFPGISQIAVFDTAFYKDLPERVYTYPLPESLRKKYGFLRYGFHGLSHEYVAGEAAKKLGCSLEKLNLITCHLGGGSSITVIKSGKAVDTSMGFTPLEGLMMMTRTGDIDPGIVLQLAQDLSIKKTEEILQKESGVLGISGLSDMLQLLKAVNRGDKKAKLALDMFVYRIQKYIGAYLVVLGGRCDALVFTGAIGSGSSKIRNMIYKDLGKIKVFSIETDEELMIAKKAKNYV